jgi:hypothetical protein
MEAIYHLTARGWKSESWPEGDRVETWRVESEQLGAARIVRWARIWHSERPSFEGRRSLFRRFGAPPLADPAAGNPGVASEIVVEA